jgi:hypothetical protein
MGLFKYGKKSEVPDELPKLAMDELKAAVQGNGNLTESFPMMYNSQVSGMPSSSQTPKAASMNTLAIAGQNNNSNNHCGFAIEKAAIMPNLAGGEDITKSAQKMMENAPRTQTGFNGAMSKESNENNEKRIEVDKSFFDDILKGISEDIKDLKKLEDWYYKRLESKDVVHDMKDYWETQKPGVIMQVVARSFKEKIDERIKKLHDLEKDWQQKYFLLIEKEEEIRKEEKELKKVLCEFLEACKKTDEEKNQAGKKK